MEKSKKGKWWLIGFLVLLIALYGAGIYYFSNYTYPRTTVNDQKRGLLPLDHAFLVDDHAKVVSVLGRNNQEHPLRAEEISFRLRNPGDPAPRQNALLWPWAVFQSHPYPIDFEMDYQEEALDQWMQEKGFIKNGPKPENAKIEIRDEVVQIVPEEEGNALDYDKLKERILLAFRDNVERVESQDLYEKPTLTQEDPKFQAEYKRLDHMLRARIVFDFDDRTFTFGPAQVVQSLTRDAAGSVAINPDSVKSWIEDMAKKTDTFGRDRRFQTTGRGTVSVPPGIYGWQIHVEKTLDKLMKLLEEGGVHEDVKPAYRHYGEARGRNDIGSTYIEVDLSRQHLWAYQKGRLVLESDLVSGTTNNKYETPVGVNQIWSMEKDRTLKGQNLDGSKYESKVKYWMPVNYRGIGFHDAPWRSAFGGNIYRTGGSHGCMNLPGKVAEQIFTTFKVNTPVVIYESATHFSPPDKVQ